MYLQLGYSQVCNKCRILRCSAIEGDAYSDLNINGAALIRGRYLFET